MSENKDKENLLNWEVQAYQSMLKAQVKFFLLTQTKSDEMVTSDIQRGYQMALKDIMKYITENL